MTKLDQPMQKILIFDADDTLWDNNRYFERAIEDAASRGGVLMIPAFATERTQDILFYLNEMLHYKRIPEMPVFVDSPLAIRATEVYGRYTESYKDEIRDL